MLSSLTGLKSLPSISSAFHTVKANLEDDPISDENSRHILTDSEFFHLSHFTLISVNVNFVGTYEVYFRFLYQNSRVCVWFIELIFEEYF